MVTGRVKRDKVLGFEMAPTIRHQALLPRELVPGSVRWSGGQRERCRGPKQHLKAGDLEIDRTASRSS